jgi:hypothetical protein
VIKYGRTNVADDVTGVPLRIKVAIEASSDNYLIFYYMLSNKTPTVKEQSNLLFSSKRMKRQAGFFFFNLRFVSPCIIVHFK